MTNEININIAALKELGSPPLLSKHKYPQSPRWSQVNQMHTLLRNEFNQVKHRRIIPGKTRWIPGDPFNKKV